MKDSPRFWRLVADRSEFRPDFARFDYDDGEDQAIELPWTPQSGADSSAVVLRHAFEATTDASRRRRVWLELDGIIGQVDVWVDGAFAGEIDCPHARYTFEVESDGEEHAVAMEMRPGHESVWSDHSEDDTVSRPVRLVHTGSARITRLKAMCSEATSDRAVVQLHTEIDCAHAGELRLRITVRSVETGDIAASTELTRNVATGANRVRLAASVDDPALWWPKDLGDQHLYELTVDVFDSNVDEASDSRSLQMGMRTAGLDGWQTFINGEAMFVRGARIPASVDEGTAEAAITRISDAGANLAYASEGVHHPALYAAADRAGVLVWQQLPQVARDRRRKRHERITRQIVDMIAHHSSVTAWVQQQHILGMWPPFTDAQRRSVERADPTREVLVAPEPFELRNLRAKNQRFVVIEEPGVAAAERIDGLRLRRNHPVRGVLSWQLDDSVLDALSALRPIAGHAGPDDDDDRLAIPVYLVNDTRKALDDARVKATLRGAGETLDWTWAGDIHSDASVHVGTMRFPLVEVGSPLSLELRVFDHAGNLVSECSVERFA